MNALTLSIGTEVKGIGFYGQDGDKTHATTGSVQVGEDGVKVFMFNSAFTCDGDRMHQGNGGIYRAFGKAVSVKGSETEAADLDAVITCEVCRKKLNLTTLAKSPAALARIAAQKAEKDAPKIAAAAARKEAAHAKEVRAAQREVKSWQSDLDHARKTANQWLIGDETPEQATARRIDNCQFYLAKAQAALAALEGQA